MHTDNHCARCGDAAMAGFCIEGTQRVTRCTGHHVMKREPLDHGPIAQPIAPTRLTTWLRRLERCNHHRDAPRY